jgi:hypothetical protein
MTLTITYPLTGTRVFNNVSQRQCNNLITYISTLQEKCEVKVTIKVEP